MIKQLQYGLVLKRTIIMIVCIGCAIFVSCGDEGEVVTPTPGDQIGPPSGEQQPPPSGEQPPPAEEQPPPGGEQQPPPLGEEQPPPAEEQPPPAEEEPPPDNGEVEDPPVEEPPVEEPPVALPGLPADVAGYETWLKLNAHPIPPAGGGDPHRGTKNVYINQERGVIAPAGPQQFPYPHGCIIVKESRSDEGFIRLIAIMRKIEGSNPAANDWKFEEYTRGGANEAFGNPITGAFCGGCHSGAANTDFVWTPLE